MTKDILTDDRRTADNKGFAIAVVPCFAGTFVQGGSSVLRMKVGAKTPRHSKPPRRYPESTRTPIRSNRPPLFYTKNEKSETSNYMPT